MSRFEDRNHAISGLRNANGSALREMYDAGRSLDEMREYLRHHIDLAWLPDDLADKYAVSDRAWNRFLNDIIRDVVPYAFRGQS